MAEAHDNAGYSEEQCVRCGWVMGRPPLNCQNDNTPHVFPSQLPQHWEGQREWVSRAHADPDALLVTNATRGSKVGADLMFEPPTEPVDGSPSMPIEFYGRAGSERDYREALHAAHRAMMNASKWLQGEYANGPDTPGAKVQILVNDALAEVSRMLDIGRDERNEQVAT